ncbi:hypothetical protein D3C76_952410 [compost metagenome]
MARNFFRRLRNTKAAGAVEAGWKAVPRPQDIAAGGFQQAMATGWTGLRNLYRGIRGESKMSNFFTGEKEVMSPRQKLSHDLRKKRAEIKAGYKIDRDAEGNFVPIIAPDEHGVPMPVKQGRVSGSLGLARDWAVGNMAMGLGWGLKTTAGLAAYGAVKSVRPLGHAAYQSYGIVRDFGIGGGAMLHSISQNKIGAWGLAVAPVAAAVGVAAYDNSEHYAVNKGIRGYEGRQLDST